ncbi:XRE family transcriptional regulator [Streptomyces sp. NPDC007088]|uniref:XRE family transcriptional regulator n=1 Tax=Streptomyces sp. NPDC007088 TaxID=3364773 RepID=UPI0036BA3ADD
MQSAIERSGRSYGQIAQDLTALARQRGHHQIATGRARVSHWASDGEQPKDPVPELLAELFTGYLKLDRSLTPADLGLRSALPDDAPVPAAASPQGLLGMGASLETVRSYTRSSRISELRAGDIEDLELSVAQFSATYSAHPPAKLWEKVAPLRERAASLLTQRRHTLREGRDLSRHAGMLSVVLAWLAHDLGDRGFVDAYCDDAWEQGHQAGDLEIGAWAEDVRCTDALYSGRDVDALAAATRGLAVAPPGSRVALRLLAQLARVYAKLGQAAQFEETMRRVRHESDRLPPHRAGLFSVDAAVVTSYGASSMVWLGQHERALESALEAIQRYEAMPLPYQAPTRLAIARLDLALAHTSLGDPRAAIDAATAALAEGRIVQSVRTRAEHVHYRLTLRYPTADGLPDLQQLLNGLPKE